MAEQFVDPAVSKAKFERELAEYRSLEKEYRSRGWFLVHAEFPRIEVVMAAPQLKPPAIVTAVAFDYSNYDAKPPSVKLVNPFSGTPYLTKELPTTLNQAVQNQAIGQLVGFPGAPFLNVNQVVPLMQWYGPDDVPFMCIAGVLEYHQHPAHTGDSWELHRKDGAGKFVRLLEVIYKHGVQPIMNYRVGMVTTGFLERPPE